MGVIYIIAIQDANVKVPTHYFVEQLHKKWPTAKIHFISDPNAHAELQWSIDSDEHFVLGNFSGGGISFKGSRGLISVAKLALWY